MLIKSNRTKILLLILTIITFSSCRRSETLITGKEIKTYANTFLKNYYSLVEQNIKLKQYQVYFDLYEKKPSTAKCFISRKRGASIEFIPFQKESFIVQTIDINIERYIFKDINLNIYDTRGNIDYTLVGNARDYKGPIFSLSSRNIISNIVFITNDGYFLDYSSERASSIFKNIVVDNIHFANYLLIKASNNKKDWSKLLAKEESQNLFFFELKLAFIHSSEFRKYKLSPVLSSKAEEIVGNENSGDYGGEYGILSFENDLDELRNMAKDNNINVEFADAVLETMRRHLNRPSWFQRNPLLTSILGALFVILICGLYKRYVKKILLNILSLFRD